jgi:hypothetical protein
LLRKIQQTEATGIPFAAVLPIALNILGTRRGTPLAIFIAELVISIGDVTAMRFRLCLGYFCKCESS